MADGYGHIGDTTEPLTLSTPAQKQCRVIVVGNEKAAQASRLYRCTSQSL